MESLRVDIGLLSKLEASKDESVILPESSSLFSDQDDGKSLNSLRSQALVSPFFVKKFEEDTSRYYEGEM
jgi:hypothetical protein